MGNPFTPKRESQDAPADAPDSKMPKTGGPAESEREDLSAPQRHTLKLPETQLIVTVATDQLHKAGQYPTRGWPSHEALYPRWDPALVIRGPICVSGKYRDLGANTDG